eukprot:11516274-Alexandrium_andersonii.AAC.2
MCIRDRPRGKQEVSTSGGNEWSDAVMLSRQPHRNGYALHMCAWLCKLHPGDHPFQARSPDCTYKQGRQLQHSLRGEGNRCRAEGLPTGWGGMK